MAFADIDYFNYLPDTVLIIVKDCSAAADEKWLVINFNGRTKNYQEEEGHNLLNRLGLKFHISRLFYECSDWLPLIGIINKAFKFEYCEPEGISGLI